MLISYVELNHLYGYVDMLLVSFLLLQQNTWDINLYKEKAYFGS